MKGGYFKMSDDKPNLHDLSKELDLVSKYLYFVRDTDIKVVEEQISEEREDIEYLLDNYPQVFLIKLILEEYL